MTARVRPLQFIVASLVIALGITWSSPRVSGQAQATQALVVDDTGSMIPEMPTVKTGLRDFITELQNTSTASGQPFPTVAFVTFKDDVTTRVVSNDPARLQAEVDALVADGGGDCPESSNAALIAAAGLLAAGSPVVLVTDADSRPDGPSIADVMSAYLAKGLPSPVSPIISGSCTDEGGGGGAGVAGDGASPALRFDVRASANGGASSQNATRLAVTAAAASADTALGVESSFKTFATLAAATHGTFVAIPEVKTSVDGATRYAHAITNLLLSAVRPTVSLVTPAAVPQGVTIALEINGAQTSFQRSSVVTVAGAGVTVLSQNVVSPTQIVANVSIAPSAALGFRDVTVTTNLGAGSVETARGLGSLQISAPSATTIVGITPSQIVQGTTTDVTVTGVDTHFVNGTSVLNLGAGVTLNRTTVSSPTQLTANVTVSASATVGFRDVTVTTGSEIAAETVAGPLLITAAPLVQPRLVSATPATGRRGKHMSLTITGVNTHFDATTTIALSGAGVAVTSATATSATSIVAVIDIAADAPLGFRDVVVRTGSEFAVLFDGVNIVAGTTHDLVVDFGPLFGIWIKSGGAGQWTLLSPTSARSIVTGDLDGNGIDEVIVDFGAPRGIWVWSNDSRWFPIHSAAVGQMVTGDLDGDGKAELIADVSGLGIWVWRTDHGWSRLHPAHPDNMAIGDIDGNGRQDLIVDFPRLGIWAFANDTLWFPLDRANSNAIVTGDLDGDRKDEVIADFPGRGIWKYSFQKPWSQIVPADASRLSTGDVDGNNQSDLIADFGKTYGIWVLKNGSSWSQLEPLTAKDIVISDLDNSGKAEVILSFPLLGLWEFANDETWTLVHVLSPRAMTAGHIKR